LKPAIKVHGFIPSSKLLRPKDREQQIGDQNESDDDPQEVGHFLKPFTGDGIEIAQPEKNDRDQDVKKIGHG
jgi:hypothetical protein